MPSYVCDQLVILRSVAPNGRSSLRRVPPGEKFSSDARPSKHWRLVDAPPPPPPVTQSEGKRIGVPNSDAKIPAEAATVKTRQEIDDMEDDDLREFITQASGKPPHHNLGRAKLLAEAHLLNEGG